MEHNADDSQVPAIDVHIPPQLRTPPKERAVDQDGKPAQLELLGPCSFENCDRYAYHNCYWKNKWKLKGGGCDEFYCDDHAYFPEGAPTPVCCQDCKNTYHGDKKRVKAFMGITIIVVALIVLILIVSMAVILGKKEPSNTTYVMVDLSEDANDEGGLEFDSEVKQEAQPLFNP